jgi:hypothetical protein
MVNQLNLCIADFNILIKSQQPVNLEEGYLPFVKEPVENPDLTINCYTGIPEYQFKNEDLLFEASNDIQKFYSIYQTDEGYGFLMFNQMKINEIQQLAYLSKDLDEWKLYTHEDEKYPLRYPCGPIMLHYLTLRNEAVMMHASCAFDGEKGRMFSGFSGVGKSTMSKLWAGEGSTIINDDRLIIRRKEDGTYVVHNTPMYYYDIPKSAPLDGIYLISHAPLNRINLIEGAMAVSRVMAFSIQNNFNQEFILKRLNFFSDMCAVVPVFDLGFTPYPEVVYFIRENEKI